MSEVGRFPFGCACFCATCNQSWGWGMNEFLDVDFTCPAQPAGQKHLARVVLNEAPAFFWLRIEWLLLQWQEHISPHARLKKLLKGWQAGYSVALWFVLIGLALVCESQYAPVSSQLSRPFFATLLGWRFADVILTNLSITITSRFPANRLRSVVLTLSGYLQVVLIYACCYAFANQAWFPQYKQGVGDAIYFSFGTIVTVGYGNLKPEQILPRAVVISELVLGLFFVVIIVGQIVAWASQTGQARGEFPLEHVLVRLG